MAKKRRTHQKWIIRDSGWQVHAQPGLPYGLGLTSIQHSRDEMLDILFSSKGMITGAVT